MTFRLARLPKGVRIVNSDGNASAEFARWWQRFAENIEAEFGALEAAAVAQTAAATATAAAASATSAATAAQSSADDLATAKALTDSYVSGCTISAADAGTDVAVTISAHTRYYGDGTSVAVSGGSLTGLAYSTTYYVYYDQASRAGGAVGYVATTTSTTAAQTGDRHTVGGVTTPAAAGTPETGQPVPPPGVWGLDFQ